MGVTRGCAGQVGLELEMVCGPGSGAKVGKGNGLYGKMAHLGQKRVGRMHVATIDYDHEMVNLVEKVCAEADCHVLFYIASSS